MYLHVFEVEVHVLVHHGDVADNVIEFFRFLVQVTYQIADGRQNADKRFIHAMKLFVRC